MKKASVKVGKEEKMDKAKMKLVTPGVLFMKKTGMMAKKKALSKRGKY